MGVTKISWTATVLPSGEIQPGYTHNSWIGCQKVSPGCDHCYAETLAHRYGWDVWGKDKPRRVTSDANWRKPLAWNRKAQADGQPAFVFSASLSDVLEDRPDLVDPRKRLIDLTKQTPWLRWLFLTKRPQNYHLLLEAGYLPSSNVWIGCTAENQRSLDLRTPWMEKIKAPVKFLSYEPAIGPLDIRGHAWIDWLICGGESGPGCRPFDLSWAHEVLAQCLRFGIPFFFKQTGGHPHKGDDPAGWPESLRVQESPEP